jgi:hypothetical protein
MRFFVLAPAAVFPAVASAQSTPCPGGEEQQATLSVVGTGPEAIDNAARFYSNLYGRPLRESRTPDWVALQWILPETAKASLPVARNIVIRAGIGGRPSVFCGLTF